MTTEDNKSKTKLLIVEDDMITAADISLQLSKLGYSVIGISTRAEDALAMIKNNRPDIILMDIVLSGSKNGIDAALQVLEQYQIPVVFLTSNTDDATFQKALSAKPFAFIAKPFQKSTMERTLQLTLQRMEVERTSEPMFPNSDHISAMDDRLFIRNNNQLVKVAFSDILYVEADRSYCKVHTENQTFLLSVPLSNFKSQLPKENFLKVHRSFVVNIQRIDAISDQHEFLMIHSHRVPVARRSKEEVVKRMRLV